MEVLRVIRTLVLGHRRIDERLDGIDERLNGIEEARRVADEQFRSVELRVVRLERRARLRGRMLRDPPEES